MAETEALYGEDLSRVHIFLFMVVKEVRLASGLRDELALVLSVCSPSCLSYVDKDELLGEVRNFTDLLVELNRISLSEQGQMERGFLDFVTTYRR